MTDFWRLLRNPSVSTALILSAVVVAGLGLVAVGWRGVAANLRVVLQLPWLISGGVAGLAVVGAAAALLTTHLQRADAAAERASLMDLQRDALRSLSVALTAQQRR